MARRSDHKRRFSHLTLGKRFLHKDDHLGKTLSFQIRKLHRREVRQWKSSRVGSALQHPTSRAELVVKVEPKWTRVELDHAIHSLKLNKTSDEFGLVAELIRYAPDELLQQPFRLFNHVLDTDPAR